MTAVRALLLPALVLLASATFVRAQGDDPLAPLPDERWDFATARHLLFRAGFGGTEAEIAEFAAAGRAEAVRRLVRIPARPKGAALAVDCPDPLLYATIRDLPAAERVKRNQASQTENRRAITALRRRWLTRMVRTPRPLEERMTLFWHGHFTSGFRDVQSARELRRQNALFRREALGNFADLLHAVAKDAAMLEYLDNNRNRRGRPNENFAREVLELFTLGLGHYEERDIVEAARAFTGWDFDRASGSYAFRSGQHDYGLKTFLGRRGRFDGEDVLAIVLEQPRCAEYLAERLFLAFVGRDPSDAERGALATTIRTGGEGGRPYDLAPALERLLGSRAFLDPRSAPPTIKGPVELVVTAVRQLELPAERLAPVMEMAATQMGQTLFEPPNVKGWPGGRAWISTSALYDRFNFAGLVTRDLDGRSFDENGRPVATGTVAQRAAAIRFPFHPEELCRRAGVSEPHAIVDHFAHRLLAVPLPEESRAELVAWLDTDLLGRAGPFELDRWDASRRLRGMLHLLLGSPEYQLK